MNRTCLIKACLFKAALAACACVLLLASCAQASKQVFPKHYTLGESAAPAAQHAPATSEVGSILEVTRIDVPPWLQGTDLYYRLDYKHDDQIAAYGLSDWVAPPARMLEQMIQNTLAADGAWRLVLGPASPAKADLSLHIRLDDFSQMFTSPQQSYGVLDATATLVDTQDGNAVAQRHFHVREQAPSADAAGGVKALNRASRQFADELQQWLGTAAKRTMPGPSAARRER